MVRLRDCIVKVSKAQSGGVLVPQLGGTLGNARSRYLVGFGDIHDSLFIINELAVINSIVYQTGCPLIECITWCFVMFPDLMCSSSRCYLLFTCTRINTAKTLR